MRYASRQFQCNKGPGKTIFVQASFHYGMGRIPEAETNAERFNELKEMGINVTFINYPNAGAIQWALDLAQQLVIKNKKWKLDNHVD